MTRPDRAPLLIVVLLVTLGACTPADERAGEPGEEPLPEEPAEERVLFVAPDGSDRDAGTEEEPFGSLTHALEQLEPGDTLYVRGGTYEERIDIAMPNADPDDPTVVASYADEEPIVRGLLWLEGGSHWIVDGINVTWDPDTGHSNEHMVKLTDGQDWIFRNAELSDAHSFAALLVAGTGSGEPTRWEVSDNCIRDTVPTNATNQDHNLYVNTGLDSGPGLVEGNVLVGAVNGQNIKLGPASDMGGAVDVVVRHNTMYDAAQNLLISGESSDNLVERNIMGGTGTAYGTIRGYELTGENNVARDNVGFDADTMILNRDGGVGVTDGGGNLFPVDPEFHATATCSDLIPNNTEVAGYGHTAAG